MLYTIVMDEDEAKWLIGILKRVQIQVALGKEEEDVDRAQSIIARIRARGRSKTVP
jgi:hypothetical protein